MSTTEDKPLGDAIRSVAAIADRVAFLDKRFGYTNSPEVRRSYQDVADLLKELAAGVERALKKTDGT